jgi:hypothetical protein
MKTKTLIAIGLGVMLAASSALAITPSDDLLIAGAARTRLWVDDLYINNPSASTVDVEVFWLERGQANPDPVSATFSIAPNETLILPDVILETFGMNRGNGAFRITASGGVVTANLIALAVIDDEFGRRTLGSGFEAVPAAAAVSAFESTDVMGMTATADFRTNLFALAGAEGVTMHLDLLDPDGGVLDTQTVSLATYEPWLSNVTDLWDATPFDNGTAHVRVTAGSMVILGSKIDNHQMSQDPTTLEAAFSAGASSVDGTYRFAIWDSEAFATGGNLEIEDGVVEAIVGTYINYDKLDGQGQAACDFLFQFGVGFEPTPVEDFAMGVEFTDSYPDSGDLTWTITFTVDDNLGFLGTVEAVGENFSGIEEGCNGSFPYLDFEGGKAE